MLRGAGLGLLAAAPAAGCAAGVAPAAKAAAAPAASAFAGWFSSLTSSVAATLIAESIKEFFVSGWESWQEPTSAMLTKQAEDGWGWHGNIYGHTIPATTLTYCCKQQEDDPKSDRFVATLATGDFVTFESWSWRAVLTFLQHAAEGKEGDDLLHVQQLLAATVLPAGPASSAGSTKHCTASWITYPARDGEVEIVLTRTEKSVDKVTVTTTGFFTKSHGTPMLRTFELT